MKTFLLVHASGLFFFVIQGGCGEEIHREVQMGPCQEGQEESFLDGQTG